MQQQLRDEKGDLENDIDEIEKRMENVVEDLINIEKQLAAETEAHWRTADQKKALEKQVATGASLFSALDSKRERLERDLDEKNKDIAALKASLARQSKPTGVRALCFPCLIRMFFPTRRSDAAAGRLPPSLARATTGPTAA